MFMSRENIKSLFLITVNSRCFESCPKTALLMDNGKVKVLSSTRQIVSGTTASSQCGVDN